MKEYIIWGKTNPQENEKLLVTKGGDGKLITEREKAEFFMQQLEEKFGCSECRIQEIDLKYPESLNKYFTGAINKKY